MGAGRTSPWLITVSTARCLSGSHLCCRAPRDAVVGLVPVFCSVKEKDKMVFMVFLSLPSDLLSGITVYMQGTWNKLFVLLYGILNSGPSVPPSSLFHIAASVITCLCIFEDGNIFTHDELLSRTHNFVFLACLASPNVSKTADWDSQCRFFESK